MQIKLTLIGTGAQRYNKNAHQPGIPISPMLPFGPGGPEEPGTPGMPDSPLGPAPQNYHQVRDPLTHPL